MGKTESNNKKGWRKAFGGIVFILVAFVLLYLQAASTYGFRLWMGDHNLQAQDFPSAILWYTRALRSAKTGHTPERISDSSFRLYRAYEGFCRWEFEGNRLWGWFAGNQINELLLNKGVLEISATGDDPWLEIIRLRLEPKRAYRFEVRQRVPAGNRGQLYWAPLTDVFNPKQYQEFAIQADNQFHEYKVEMAPIQEEIGKIRFIPADAAGRIAIDWIRILPSGDK